MATSRVSHPPTERKGSASTAAGGKLAPSRAPLAFAALLLFIAIVYTNPSNLWPALGDYGYAKWAAGASLLALGGAWLLGDRRLTVGGVTGGCLLGFFALVGASAGWSLWPSLTVDTFSDGVKYLAMFLLVANVVDDRRRAALLLHALAWASLAPALGAIHSWARGEHLVEGDRAAWIGVFANPNDLAYFLAVGGAMVLGARELVRARWLRLLYLGLLALLAAALLLTQSRGGMIAGGAVLALWGIRGLRHRRAALGVVVLLLGVLLFAPEKTWQRAGTALDYDEDLSAQGRIDAWRTGVRVMADRPLGGVGAGAFLLAWPEYAPGDAGAPRTAHNTFIQLVAETGVPSLLLFLGALAAALAGLERAARRAAPGDLLATAARATQVGLCAFLVSSATGGLAYSWPLYLLLGLGAGIAGIAQSAEVDRPAIQKGG